MKTVSIGGIDNIEVSDEVAKIIEFSKKQAAYQEDMAAKSSEDDVKQGWLDAAEKSTGFAIQLMHTYFDVMRESDAA
jgi:hypothetical protein